MRAEPQMLCHHNEELVQAALWSAGMTQQRTANLSRSTPEPTIGARDAESRRGQSITAWLRRANGRYWAPL